MVSSWFDRDPKQLIQNPNRDWLILVVLFFLFFIVIIASLGVFRGKILSQRDSQTSTAAQVEKLNEKGLQILVTERHQRAQELEVLKNAKPVVIDPGI